MGNGIPQSATRGNEFPRQQSPVLDISRPGCGPGAGEAATEQQTRYAEPWRGSVWSTSWASWYTEEKSYFFPSFGFQ